jgi:16S rRNA (guanine527-N7)-methyltransferase
MEGKLTAYFHLLEQWNRKIRLVSEVRDAAAFERAHVEDVRELLPLLGEARSLIDLGTGAGLPGLVIKILKPGLEVTVVDATRKKIAFCEEVVRQLGLSGVRAICGRAESVAVQREVGRADAVVSRATWGISKYLEISIRYVSSARHGTIFAFKGPQWEEDLSDAEAVMGARGVTLQYAHEYRIDSKKRWILAFGVG